METIDFPKPRLPLLLLILMKWNEMIKWCSYMIKSVRAWIRIELNASSKETRKNKESLIWQQLQLITWVLGTVLFRLLSNYTCLVQWLSFPLQQMNMLLQMCSLEMRVTQRVIHSMNKIYLNNWKRENSVSLVEVTQQQRLTLFCDHFCKIASQTRRSFINLHLNKQKLGKLLSQ